MSSATGEVARRTVRVCVTGRVQGVWYREWTRRTAAEFGLSGWVRNRRDGSVEAVFSGPRSLVGQMIVRCRNGSPMSDVDDVVVLSEDDAAPGGSFEVRSTV